MTTPTESLESTWRRKFPKISIDHEKCTVPFVCKECLQICPEAVFYVVEDRAKQERLREMDPRVDGNYLLYAPFVNKCTMCNKCIDVCPADAIQVELPE